MNAISPITQSSRQGTEVRTDGSIVVSEEQLRHFGFGDAKQGRKDLRTLLSLDRDGPVLSGPTECPKSIRIAGPDDEAAILDLLLMDLRENAEHIAPIDEAKVLEQIRSGTRKRGSQVAVIDGPDKKPIAVCIVALVQWWWSQGWHLFEIVMFVHPEHRWSRHADDLLAYEKWLADDFSRKIGHRWYLLCGVLGAWRVNAKITLYRKKFARAGAAFLYPPPPIRGN